MLLVAGEKKKESKTASAEKEIFAHGYADEPRPDTNLITGDSHRWRNADGEFPAKKGKKSSPKTDSPKKEKGEKKKMKSPSVSELREKILDLAPEKDLKGMKKKQLVGLLEYLQKPQEVGEGVPQVEEAVPPVEETGDDVPEVQADLEEEIDDDLDQYDAVDYQGVEYLVKGDQLFNADIELIGTWDGMVATFTTDEAKDKHLAEKDSDDEDDDA